MTDDVHPSTASIVKPSSELIRRVQLEVIDGKDRGLVHVTTRERTVIGTRSIADIVLADPAVSRFHCALTLRGALVEIEDLDSRNGTHVNGVSIGTAWLDRDATIEVGTTKLRCRVVDELIEVEVSPSHKFGELHGVSREMRAVFAQCERAARSDATVLLQGETGTGKDAAATSIHLESVRKNQPFVVLDCSAVPPGLVESHLFGHERGAFTGALAAHAGVFETASGGTLFLDEIGELPLELQPKLLRAIETRTIRRVGGSSDQPCDVRVIAATNRDLQREVNGGRFRADLYFRLAIIEIRMPALRERAQDIPLLVEQLLRSMEAEGPTAAQLRSATSLEQLSRHPWPGNVRELSNYLERSLAFDEPAPLSSTSAPGAPAIDPSEPLRTARDRWLKYFEQQYLQTLLRKHNGNVAKAARAAGVARVHFYRLMARAGLPSSTR